MKAIANAHITFGLVTIGTTIYSAQQAKDISFRLVHRDCMTPINNRRYCSHHDVILEEKDVARAYEHEKGKLILIENGDLPVVETEDGRPIEIIRFINMTEIDPVHYEKAYFLAPIPVSRAAFHMLHMAMSGKKKAALGTVVMREKEHMVLLRPYQSGLMMHTLFYADEVRDVNELDLGVGIVPNPGHLRMAQEIIAGLTAPAALNDLHDGFRNKVMAMITEKVAGRKAPAKPKTPSRAAEDITDKLKQSLALMAKSGVPKNGPTKKKVGVK